MRIALSAMIALLFCATIARSEELKFDGQTFDIPQAQMKFEPVRYRPIPAVVAGSSQVRQSLDGIWKICPTPDAKGLREKPLDGDDWREISIPGQWRQQGFNLPRNKTVSMARSFEVPREWAGQRIFLRFDSIHAGTRYWLNGRELGASEALYTPIEWEITSHVRFGERNRIDLEMVVDTPSERMSVSSNYAFHNLGGIDRSVSIFALPPVHVRSLKIETDLDDRYADADLKLEIVIDKPEDHTLQDLSVEISLSGPDGQGVEHSNPSVSIDRPKSAITTRVTNPLKWNAEKPHLYALAIELKRGRQLLERIERKIGFREIEVRGSELLVNGAPVKLRGIGRHEMDPLTGRADTMRHAETDVRLLKAANINYIRGCHYAPTMELVEAADKYGMYLEVEAPFCWVYDFKDLKHLREVLTPTAAMLDYYNANPSVIIWSLANESAFLPVFEVSAQMVKQLDSTRATTFNWGDPKRLCDIANSHYPPMPYDEVDKADPRPPLLGEFYFPVCHEQTDVLINPGLREFFGFGHADPESEFAKKAAESFTKPHLKPTIPPGAWTHIVRSKRIIGGAIFAATDDAFYFSDGSHAGYAWHHGFWGILDGWRRPKPEWWMTKMVFSPVWFPKRQVEFAPGQAIVAIPVENRYAFTDLSELKLTWEIGNKHGEVQGAVPPSKTGILEIPVSAETPTGSKLIVRAHDGDGELITVAAIVLGEEPAPQPLPTPTAGIPAIEENGSLVIVKGETFALVIDKQSGEFRATDPRHQSPVIGFPKLHVTRYDFGDLAGPKAEPYAVFPDAKTRVVEEVTVKPAGNHVELTVRDRYESFAGAVTWQIDQRGVGKVRYDYNYTGGEMNTRELGVRIDLAPACDELNWRRWSEWGDFFPDDSISRTVGEARSLRTGKREADPGHVRPTWPWSLDQTELGTADFRSIKFNIEQASLHAPDGAGLRIRAHRDAHVRACLAKTSVLMHLLSRCEMGQVVIKPNDRLTGAFVVELTQ